MKPAPFKYYAPTSIEEALDYLATYGTEGKILAGGQSLIPTMNFRLAQPSVLIDLNPISALAYIEPHSDGGLRIGAMTRQRAVERGALVVERAPLVQAAMPYIAHPQIRNRGTFGGSMAHADPAAELPAVAMALEARFHLRSRRGERWVAAKDFFIDLFTTALEPDELLVEVAFPPMPPRSGWSFQEVARRHGDYALVGVAALVVVDDQGLSEMPSGVCEAARLAFFSVGPGPVVTEQAAALLEGQAPTPEAIEAAAAAVTTDLDPSADIQASVAYRRHLAGVLAHKALTEAFSRVGNS